MAKLLFSLPVHERPDIVRDQIENINYFCPDSLIVLHVSSGATAHKDEFQRHGDFENVLINPVSLETIYTKGLLHTHVSNFMYALEKNLDFETIVLISSNELFVKPGLVDYVGRYRIGAQTEVYDKATDWALFRDNILESPQMQGFLKSVELPRYFGGQAEGQFFRKNIFTRLARGFVDNFPMGPCDYPSEEIIPATIAARYGLTGVDIALPITICNYCNNLEIDEDVIERVRTGTGSVFALRRPRTLRSPHIGASVLEGVFSVKRVPREDCELRRHIRGFMT